MMNEVDRRPFKWRIKSEEKKGEERRDENRGKREERWDKNRGKVEEEKVGSRGVDKTEKEEKNKKKKDNINGTFPT